MTPTAGIFGIHNHTASLVVELALVVLAVIWLALIYWTWADARRRIADGILVACATITSFFPFIGTIVYMIVRPPEYLEDVHERDLEIQAAQARLAQIGVHTCPYCDHEVEKEFLRCPHCLRKLRDPCVELRQAAGRRTGRSARTARPTANSIRRWQRASVAAAPVATRSRRWSRRRHRT